MRYHELAIAAGKSPSWPEKITIVGFEMKRRRFVELHRAALRWPQDRFHYIGVDLADREKSEQAAQGEVSPQRPHWFAARASYHINALLICSCSTDISHIPKICMDAQVNSPLKEIRETRLLGFTHTIPPTQSSHRSSTGVQAQVPYNPKSIEVRFRGIDSKRER